MKAQPNDLTVWGRIVPASTVAFLIGMLAFLVRLVSVQRSGGLSSALANDDGVYFAASTALTHGQLPYRDFLLVHPPGAEVLLAPFAFAARFTSDAAMFETARVSMMILGAVNAMLIFLVGRRAGMAAGLIAGIGYAVWFPLVLTERTTYLEGFVSFAVLVSLALIRVKTDTLNRVLVAGAFMGLGISVKLWAVIPCAVFAGWLILGRSGRTWRNAVAYLAAATAVALAVMGPFLAAAPAEMIRMTVLDQIGRDEGKARGVRRLPATFDVYLAGFDGRAPLLIGFAILAVLAAAAIVAAWKVPRSRLWVALMAVTLGVVMYTPTFFVNYQAFSAIGSLLVLGTVAQLAFDSPRFAIARHRLRSSGIAPAKAAVCGTGILLVSLIALSGTRSFGTPLPSADVSAVVSSAACVTTNYPETLILTNRLSRNLANGCPTVIDFSGAVFEQDDYRAAAAAGSPRPRSESTGFQRFAVRYLRSGDYIILRRNELSFLSAQTRTRLKQRSTLHVRTNDWILYGTRTPSANATAGVVKTGF